MASHRHIRPFHPHEKYIEVQNGYPAVGLLAVTVGLTILSGWLWGPTLLGTLLLLLQLSLVVCFCSLVIRANRWGIFWQFGPGWVRGAIPLCDIASCQVIASHLAYGWGFQRTSQGWRYCRSGSSVLVIHRQNGTRVRLSTPRAHELRRFIHHAIEPRHRS